LKENRLKKGDFNRILIRPYPRWKRISDILVSLAALIAAAPLMLLIAAAIRVTTPGPALFRQLRGGHGGEPFYLYKFRSMVPDAEKKKGELLRFNERSGPAFKMKEDPRVTRTGRFLRRTSLDELPQLFNVLKGDMALVGPRPLPVEEEDGYARWHRRRLAVKPGLTCIWQVSSRDESDFDKWVRLDIEYIHNQSVWLDLKLLMQTIPAVLFRRGAH
jgi:lipopolysaccharide/colanic/teichoic acid biosynthesis glycosyltransferase